MLSTIRPRLDRSFGGVCFGLLLLVVLGVVIYDSELVYTLQGTEKRCSCSIRSNNNDVDNDNDDNDTTRQEQKTQMMVQQITEEKASGVLSVFTLSYDPHVEDALMSQRLSEKRQRAQDIVMHNCLLTKHHDPSSQDFQFIIITDDLSMNVCQHCECRLFVPYNCSCPIDDCSDRRNVCEKNHLFSDLLQQQDEFVFVDFDLVMLYPTVLQELRARSQTTDFLATRAHGSFNKKPKYREDFNSGLVYIRHVPEADPALLRQYTYTKVANAHYDQAILSYFVHQHYHRWDELSIKWHCRLLREPKRKNALTKKKTTTRQEDTYNGIYGDMNIHDCQTLHPPRDSMLELLNYTLLRP
jgi:hypothetical protein